MKTSTKAALLSALVFPGLGHLALKNYLRGAIVGALAFAALSVAYKAAFDQAMAAVNKITSGEVSMDSTSILDLAANSASAAATQQANLSILMFLACWLFGVFDSYRLGALQERKEGGNP